jgi:hypothetical protein
MLYAAPIYICGALPGVGMWQTHCERTWHNYCAAAYIS